MAVAETESDRRFISALKKSEEAVIAVTRYLHNQGHTVLVRPVSIRPSFEKRWEYIDDGDLEIIQSKHIEVKHRDIDFSGTHDFPFDQVFIDSCYKYDTKKQKPYAYFLVNKKMTGAFIVKCETAPQWTKATTYTANMKREEKIYQCSLDLVEYRLLEGSE